MPKKKTVKKTLNKAKRGKKPAKLQRSDHHFLGILVLFAGFSVYAIASFFTATNDHIDNIRLSVIDSEVALNGEVEEAEPENLEPARPLFTDFNSHNPNFDAVEALYFAGVIDGYADGTFRPTQKVNRAELIAILANAVDADLTEVDMDDCFRDVNGEWFAPFVCYAKQVGWVSGRDGYINAGGEVSKAETLKVIFTAFDYPVCDEVLAEPYKDVSVEAWYAPYACQAKADGVVSGGGFFSPDYTLTRSDFAKVLYNVMVKKGEL